MTRLRCQYIRLSLMVLLCLGLASCAVQHQQGYLVGGTPYCVVSGIWRNRWWQHYERGLSCAAGGLWDEAIASFQAALASQRGQHDRWRVNTYGVHFVDDYFPHRELGIVYAQLGRYEDAQRELELSLRMTATGRAKFYLNQVRRTWLQATQRDMAPPRIILASPGNELLTKDLSITVRGQVEDDTYVHALEINGHEQFVELAVPRLPFEREVSLRDGLNRIDIVATDLAGRQTHQQVLVRLDRYGPHLGLQRVERLAGPPAHVRLQGEVSDQNPITRFLLAGQEVRLGPTNAGTFVEDITVQPGITSLPFTAEDAAGNVTRGDIALELPDSSPASTRQGGILPAVRHQWAFLQPTPILSDLVALTPATVVSASRPGREPTAPVIALTGQPFAGGAGPCRTQAQVVVAENSILLELKVTDTSSITRVAIDGQPLAHAHGVQLFFTEIVPLQLDSLNGFVIEATNALGNTTRCELVVQHEVRKVRQLGYRLKVLQTPFERKHGCDATALMATAEEYVFSAFLERKRFNMRKLARLDASHNSEADVVLKGIVCEGHTAQGVPFFLVFADFVDADGGGASDDDAERIREDVYGESLDQAGVRKLMTGLVFKMAQHFPVVEGYVSENTGKKIFTSLGRAHNIRSRMKLLVFREEPDGTLSAPKHAAQAILGEARITGIHESFSEAAMIKPGTLEAIRPHDRVVTK